MSGADLNALEREVELTRAKFADDLARLRSPENRARFKEDLWAHAREEGRHRRRLESARRR